MKRKDYILDENFEFKKKGTGWWDVVKTFFRYLLGSISLAVVYYVVACLFVSTDLEKALIRENRALARNYPVMEEKMELLEDVILGLEVRDEGIYEDIFRSSAPAASRVSTEDFYAGVDSIPDYRILDYSAMKMARTEAAASRTEENFRLILDSLHRSQALPPLGMPVDGFSFARTGASVGTKMSPFYKVETSHNGLDLLCPTGSPVRASAAGVVTELIRSGKGLGNVVVISHPGGESTSGAHLSGIKAVKGKSVRKGDIIGYVGMSGNTYAPHLHYEVWRDTLALDPVDYVLGDISPEDYEKMRIIAASTGQSMD
ncbi:MAG: M23 family metallopeptidase [Bacteroidales bacterium]|nr:M23 family metallopeptidase [Bacteroidales bacterium]